jgi:DNA-binding transcriptional LysR family regulator
MSAMAALPEVELRLVRAFVVLAEELNFGRAAERLHMTQPALSAQLRQLEDRLDYKLFERSTRRVGLTRNGAALLEPARALLAESRRFGSVAAQLKGRPHRRLVFGAALYTLGIPERQVLLEAFFERHPDIPLTVSPLWQREMAEALLRGEADLALMLGVAVSLARWEAEPSGEVMFPDALPRLILRRERLALLLPRESPLAAFEETPLAALAGETVAMLGGAHGTPIVGPLREVLGGADARLMTPPEPHGMGVERYGRQFRIPAVSLGWVGTGGADDPDMVRRHVEGLTLETELALVRAPSVGHPAAELFWQEAQARFPEALVAPGRG